MKILIVEPRKRPYESEIEDSLAAMQHVVGDSIEAIYPFSDPVAIVCNEEGKLIGLEPNRVMVDSQGHVYDIINGTFFVAGLTEDDFGSLSDELIQKYKSVFSGLFCVRGETE